LSFSWRWHRKLINCSCYIHGGSNSCLVLIDYVCCLGVHLRFLSRIVVLVFVKWELISWVAKQSGPRRCVKSGRVSTLVATFANQLTSNTTWYWEWCTQSLDSKPRELCLHVSWIVPCWHSKWTKASCRQRLTKAGSGKIYAVFAQWRLSKAVDRPQCCNVWFCLLFPLLPCSCWFSSGWAFGGM
jgi:hypothetical protein